jgi:hypothetical protein
MNELKTIEDNLKAAKDAAIQLEPANPRANALRARIDSALQMLDALKLEPAVKTNAETLKTETLK